MVDKLREQFKHLSDEEYKELQLSMFEASTTKQFGDFKVSALGPANNYVFDRNGIFYFKKTRSAIVGKKISNFGMLGLPVLFNQEAIVHNLIPKIPYSMYLQILSFFRKVMKVHNNAEAYCQIYWDLEEKKHLFHVPKQKVSGAAVKYNPEENLDVKNFERYVHVFECHSHNNMGAFWSGTDNKDENETRYFGVFGQLGKPDHAELFRIFVNKQEIGLSRGVIFEDPEVSEETKKVSEMLAKKKEALSKLEAEVHELEKILSSEKSGTPEVPVPEEWMKNVTKSYGSYKTGGYVPTRSFPSMGNQHSFSHNFHNQKKEQNGMPGEEEPQQADIDALYDSAEEEDRMLYGEIADEHESKLSDRLNDIEDSVMEILENTESFTEMFSTEQFFETLENMGALHSLISKLQERGQL